MKNIVFLGSKKIGYQCLEHLVDVKDDLGVNIVGVLTNPKRSGGIEELCEQNNIQILHSLDEYLNLSEVDIAISIQYHQILKKKHIEKANEITINLHMAPLPEYRGCNQFSYAILNGDSMFGTTIHRLEEGIDNGAILFEKRFPIPEKYWVKDLLDLTHVRSVELFKESIPEIISGNYTLTPQEELTLERKQSFHLRKEIDQLKSINLEENKETIHNRIKATYMPGFEPPFTYIDNKKVYFVLEEDLKNQ
jgi:methionyl-tRNA formyltransferase